MGWIWKAVRKEHMRQRPAALGSFYAMSVKAICCVNINALAGQVTKDCRGCLGCMAVLLDEEDKGVCASADMD